MTLIANRLVKCGTISVHRVILTAVKDVVIIWTSLDIVSVVAVDCGNIEDLIFAHTVKHESLSDGAFVEVSAATHVGYEVFHPLQASHGQLVVWVGP